MQEKILFICLILWMILQVAAFPGTTFYNWGIKKFGSYLVLLITIALIYLIPIIISVLCEKY
jgi:MFS-type transporter involved in bile tolerance (Atg22 family)